MTAFQWVAFIVVVAVGLLTAGLLYVMIREWKR